jgi:prepilin peptidase CpaA
LASRPRAIARPGRPNLPPLEIARWSVAGFFALLLGVAAVSDIGTRRIPNWTVLAIAALFVPWHFLQPSISLLSSLAAASLALSVGVALYAFKFMGAGDAKLMAAIALFAGMDHLAPFALMASLAGGVMAVVVLLSRPWRGLATFTRPSVDPGRGVPYGVALAVGGVATLFGILLGYLG